MRARDAFQWPFSILDRYGTEILARSASSSWVHWFACRSSRTRAPILFRAILLLRAFCLAPAAHAGEATLTGPAHVVDGDTLRIGGIGVPMKGISAPDRGEPGYQEAADVLRDLIGNRPVTCQLTGETTKGRAVGYCSAGSQDLQAELVRRGLVKACPAYSKRYVELEAEPRAPRWRMGDRVQAAGLLRPVAGRKSFLPAIPESAARWPLLLRG